MTLPPHDILTLLEREHGELQELLSLILTDCWHEKEIAPGRIEQVIQLVSLHTLAEETLIYPQAEQLHAQTACDGITERSYQAHEQFKSRLSHLLKITDPDLLTYQCREILETLIEHHQAEEARLFPVLRKAWGEETLYELGERMLSLREKAIH